MQITLLHGDSAAQRMRARRSPLERTMCHQVMEFLLKLGLLWLWMGALVRLWMGHDGFISVVRFWEVQVNKRLN